MNKLSKQKILSTIKLIDLMAGIALLAGLIMSAFYIAGIKAPEKLILSLIFGGFFINLLLAIKLKSDSSLVQTLQSIWLLF